MGSRWALGQGQRVGPGKSGEDSPHSKDEPADGKAEDLPRLKVAAVLGQAGKNPGLLGRGLMEVFGVLEVSGLKLR